MTSTAGSRAPLKSWTDKNTGKTVTLVTDLAGIGYFRNPKHLPDGRILAAGGADWRKTGRAGTLVAIDPETCDVEVLDQDALWYMRLSPTTGQAWFIKGGKRAGRHRELWEVTLPYGEPRLVKELPDDLPGNVADITCDGRFLLLEEQINTEGAFPIPTTMSAQDIWRYINRRRRGAIYSYDILNDRVGRLVEMTHVSPAHTEPSPVDPTVVRFTEDVLECTGQRMYHVKIDGSERRPLRRQEYGEMITHEFWWSDPRYVGYTYMDRRDDPTVLEYPWCEYATRPTHLGICDLQGREVYLSDPLNSYHAHLYMSPDGSVVCGEGTAWNNFMCAGHFSWNTTKLDLQRLATIHTPWVPTRGTGANCALSRCNKWILYNDTIEGKRQICRVAVD